MSSKRKDKLLETSTRFSSREAGHPSLVVSDAVFSVNKPVLINGFGVFGGSSEDVYKYKISILKVIVHMSKPFVSDVPIRDLPIFW